MPFLSFQKYLYILFSNRQYENKHFFWGFELCRNKRKQRWFSVFFDINSAKYLVDDPLLHHIRHDLEVDGPCNNTGWMSPKVWVPVWQHPFNLLNLKRQKKKKKSYLEPCKGSSMISAEDIHVLPFPTHCSGLFRFLVGFVEGEPHTRPSAKEWHWRKSAGRWRVNKWGQRSTSQTDGWGWWRWWPQHFPRYQPGRGGKHLLNREDLLVFLAVRRDAPQFNLKHAPLMLAFIPTPPLEWEWPCPLCTWLLWEWPWPPWLCSPWEWPWCEWPWSWDEQLFPPWEWAWLKAHIPTRLTSRPPTETGCIRPTQLIKDGNYTPSSRLNISYQLETSAPSHTILTVSMSVLMLGGSNKRVIDSTKTKNAMTIRKRPLMNPDRISTRPNLLGKVHWKKNLFIYF